MVVVIRSHIYVYIYISYIMLCNLNIQGSFPSCTCSMSILLHVLRVFGFFFGRDLRRENIPPMATNDPRWTWPRTSNHQRLGPMRKIAEKTKHITLEIMGRLFFFFGWMEFWNHETVTCDLEQVFVSRKNCGKCMQMWLFWSSYVTITGCIIHGCMSFFFSNLVIKS